MEGFTEKKWFVYLGDHHEGPFSLHEIQGKLNAGQVSATQYVWCDGMTDWKLMSEVDAFEPLRNATPAPPPTLGAGATLDREEQASGSLKKIHLTTIRGGGTESFIPKTPKKVTAVTPTGKASKKRRVSRGFVAVLLLLLALVGGGFSVFSGRSDWLAQQSWVLKIPFLGEMLSPIPLVDDVTNEDFEELRFAASAQTGSVRTAVVAGQSDLFAPVFYVASGAPDGIELQLRLEGIPETLLNETSADFSVRQTLQKHFARFEAIRGAGGKPIPRGSYRVSVLNGAQVVASKTIFLGGVKDATYLTRLKEFHDKVWEKATAELTELKQFSATLDEQLQITNKDFAEVNRRYLRGNPGAKRTWEEMSKKWKGLQSQLDETFSRWTPESLKTDYFYGDLRGQVQTLGQQVGSLHGLQTAFYESREKATEVEPQIVISMQATQAFAQKLAKTLDDLNAVVTNRTTPLPPKDVATVSAGTSSGSVGGGTR